MSWLSRLFCSALICIKTKVIISVSQSIWCLEQTSASPCLKCPDPRRRADHSWPIRGQYPGHVTTLDQSEFKRPMLCCISCLKCPDEERRRRGGVKWGLIPLMIPKYNPRQYRVMLNLRYPTILAKNRVFFTVDYWKGEWHRQYILIWGKRARSRWYRRRLS